MNKKKRRKIERALEREYRNCASAEEYLQAIMRIWTENGLAQGEWFCDLGRERA